MILSTGQRPFLWVDAADSPTRIVFVRRQHSHGVLMDLLTLCSSSC
jgi:hypothetical protein